METRIHELLEKLVNRLSEEKGKQYKFNQIMDEDKIEITISDNGFTSTLLSIGRNYTDNFGVITHRDDESLVNEAIDLIILRGLISMYRYPVEMIEKARNDDFFKRMYRDKVPFDLYHILQHE